MTKNIFTYYCYLKQKSKDKKKVKILEKFKNKQQMKKEKLF